MRIDRQRKKIEAELTEAQRSRDYLRTIKLKKQLDELDKTDAELERVTLSVATRDKDLDFRREVSKAVVGCVVAADILQLQAMKLRQLTLSIPEYDVPINKQLKGIIRALGDIVNVIDETSQHTKPINDHGRLITLSDHYTEIVDEVEAKIYGWENIISKIVNEKIAFDE